MARIIRSEWHQLERRYYVEVDKKLLQKVYPFYTEEEVNIIYDSITNGTMDLKEIMILCEEDNIEVNWMHELDDVWSNRKGGYDVSYELDYGD